MKWNLIIIFLLCVCRSVSAQTDTTFRFLKRLEGDIVSFTVDNLDNIYLLNSKNQLKKLNANGDSVAVYNDVKRFGVATLIDVSNPLKVLMYYKNFSTIVVLDRFLDLKNTIDLRSKNILQAKVVAQSYDNKIWVYDEVENKLKKIDDEGKLLLETSDFRLLLDEAVSPQYISDINLNVYVYDSAKGVYVFDYYGALKNKILIYRWQNLKVAGNYIFGSVADTLYRYEIGSFRYDEWKLPPQIKNSSLFDFSSSRLYALKKEGLEIFSIRQ